MIDDSCLTFENNDAVWEALRDYEQTKRAQGKALDFADALIISKAKHWTMARGIALAGVYSFDKAVSQLDGARGL